MRRKSLPSLTWTARWWEAPAWIRGRSARSSPGPAAERYNQLFMYYLVAAIYIVVCLVLMLVVLLQQGKGGDIANAFGGGGSQAAFGARSGATVLSRATTICAVL